MSKEKAVTPSEIREALLIWEYAQDIIDVTPLDYPLNSVPPIINIRRRIVGQWEPVND